MVGNTNPLPTGRFGLKKKPRKLQKLQLLLKLPKVLKPLEIWPWKPPLKEK